MKAYFPDKVSWQDSQGLYHAAAHLGQEALFILRPATPYVCIGFHQDAKQEIDLEFARENKIPVIRREVGGGAVYLDGGQLFYQLILRADRSEVPAKKGEFYEKFLAPVIETYREFGVDARFKPVNDIIVNHRKISGNGAAEINGMIVLVGNFILDFDYEMMSKVLRVPDEKFRDKVFKTLQENLTTIERVTGSRPSTKALADVVLARYQHILGDFPIQTDVDDELKRKSNALFRSMYSPDWLYMNDRRQPDIKEVKISEGTYVIQKVVKTPGGLVRVNGVRKDDRLQEVHISGDFFFYPAPRLEDLEFSLEGIQFDQHVIENQIQLFYQQYAIESPGLNPADFAQIIAG